MRAAKAQASMRRLVRAIAARTHKGHSLMKVRVKLYASAERACLKNDFTLDWLQSLKQIFINVSYHILIASISDGF